MFGISIPKNPGHVVIGIDKDEDGVFVYAYYGNRSNERLTFRHDPRTGNVLWLVEDVAHTAEAAGAYAVSYSSTVDFWEEAIA